MKEKQKYGRKWARQAGALRETDAEAVSCLVPFEDWTRRKNYLSAVLEITCQMGKMGFLPYSWFPSG